LRNWNNRATEDARREESREKKNRCEMRKTGKTSTRGARAAKKAAKRTTSTPRARKAQKELTALETAMIAWKDTYAKRHKRMD
jgi:hypothetical protein